jgi:galactose oxidase
MSSILEVNSARVDLGRPLVLSLATLAVVSLSGSIARAELVRTAFSPLVVASTGKCLDIADASSTPGASAVVWRCNLNSNEQWTVQPFNGAHRVIVQHSGQCLSVAGGSTAAGAQIVQNTCSGANSELWTFPVGASGVQLRNSNSALCASVSAASTADGASVVQSPCSSSSTHFNWSFSSGLFAPTTPLVLQANHSGKCMNVSGNSTSSGANIIQWPCAGTGNERFTAVPQGNFYQVVAQHSGMCLTVNGASTSSGASIVQSACGTEANKLWTLRAVGRAYQLVAQNSGLCATISGASQANAAQVVQSPCGTGQNQLWSVSAATLRSSWTGVIPLAVNPIALANLPDGNLLMWSAYDRFTFQGDVGNANSRTYTSVFEPASSSSSEILVTHTGYDMFCPGTANLPDGRILVNGGSSSPKTSLYDPATTRWSSSGLMNIPRGYQGTTLLSNGSVFTLGGSWSGGRGGKHGELWANDTWTRLSGVSADPVTGPDPAGAYRGDNHLWLFAASDGRVFHAGPSRAMHWITTSGSGSITPAGNRGDDAYAINGNAVLYDVGRVLKAGGAPAYELTNATSSAYRIQFTGTVTVNKLAPMAYARAFANAVVLPNGQVVIVGGQTFPVPFSDNTAILVPELWDPETLVFRQLAPMQTPRVYHSSAILLPDGRVFVGGGGQCGQGCSANHFNTEILTPPYLLNADGSAATRPSITSVPSTASIGGTLAVTTSTPVMSFALVRLSSVTHTVNNDQRRVPLTIQSTTGTSSYTLSIPNDAGTVLPGYYMLFAMDPKGVPSVAATVRIN